MHAPLVGIQGGEAWRRCPVSGIEKRKRTCVRCAADATRSWSREKFQRTADRATSLGLVRGTCRRRSAGRCRVAAVECEAAGFVSFIGRSDAPVAFDGLSDERGERPGIGGLLSIEPLEHASPIVLRAVLAELELSFNPIGRPAYRGDPRGWQHNQTGWAAKVSVMCAVTRASEKRRDSVTLRVPRGSVIVAGDSPVRSLRARNDSRCLAACGCRSACASLARPWHAAS